MVVIAKAGAMRALAIGVSLGLYSYELLEAEFSRVILLQVR
jgi:hypothetical protein